MGILLQGNVSPARPHEVFPQLIVYSSRTLWPQTHFIAITHEPRGPGEGEFHGEMLYPSDDLDLAGVCFDPRFLKFSSLPKNCWPPRSIRFYLITIPSLPHSGFCFNIHFRSCSFQKPLYLLYRFSPATRLFIFTALSAFSLLHRIPNPFCIA